MMIVVIYKNTFFKKLTALKRLKSLKYRDTYAIYMPVFEAGMGKQIIYRVGHQLGVSHVIDEYGRAWPWNLFRSSISFSV